MASLTERGKGIPSTGDLVSWNRDRTGDGDSLVASVSLGAASFRHLSNLTGYAPTVALTTHLPPGPCHEPAFIAEAASRLCESPYNEGGPLSLTHAPAPPRGKGKRLQAPRSVPGAWGLGMAREPPLLCLSLALFPWQPNSLVCPGSPGQLLQKPQGLLSKPWSFLGVGSLTPSGNLPERQQSPPSTLPWGCPAAASLR